MRRAKITHERRVVRPSRLNSCARTTFIRARQAPVVALLFELHNPVIDAVLKRLASAERENINALVSVDP
jgi:hypothetical protein